MMLESLTSFALENFPLLTLIFVLVAIPVYIGSKWIRAAVNNHIKQDDAAHSALANKAVEIDEKSRKRDDEIKNEIQKQASLSEERDKNLNSKLEKQSEQLIKIDKELYGISKSLTPAHGENEK